MPTLKTLIVGLTFWAVASVAGILVGQATDSIFGVLTVWGVFIGQVAIFLKIMNRRLDRQ